MAPFHFDLVSTEKVLFDSQVVQVDVPGSEGYFGVLAGHAPLITTLRPGVLLIYGEGGEQLRVVVNGGFAEVGPSGLTVVADTAGASGRVPSRGGVGGAQEMGDGGADDTQ